jgi:hypothetical protein
MITVDAMATADVGDLGTLLEPRHHPIECGEPCTDQVGAIAGPEEALGAGEEARMVICPRQRAVAAHRGDQLVLVQIHAGQNDRPARHVDRGVLVRKRHGLLFGQPEPALVVFDVAARRLAVEPLAHEPGVAVGALRQLLWRYKASVGHRAVQPQFLTKDHVSHDGCATNIADSLPRTRGV